MNQVQKKYVILGSLCALVLTLAVGYAAFNTVLKINGTTSISSNWDIEITNIRGGNPDKNSDAYDITAPTFTKTTATFNTGLITPGTSSRTYEVEISNKGSLAGIITVANLSCGDNDAISCSVFATPKQVYTSEWTGGVLADFLSIGTGDYRDSYFPIDKGEKHYIYVQVYYKNTVTSQPEKTSANIKLELNYEQEGVNESGAIPPASSSDGVLYSYDQNRSIGVGAKIKPTNYYVEDYNALNRTIFLKHDVVNNMIESISVCFKKEGQLYCLQGKEDGSTFEANKTILLSAFGEDLCYGDETSASCSNEDNSLSISTDTSGYINASYSLADGSEDSYIDLFSEKEVWTY